ncbi:MAG: type I restriction-modification enzyme R subunit C-terminal domain-containing protein [Simkaniaceae bacterium]|jgi:type I restriction enzyme R subunit
MNSSKKSFNLEEIENALQLKFPELGALCDELAHVAYAFPKQTPEEGTTRAKVLTNQHFDTKQQIFLDFVLNQYVKLCVEELEKEKLGPLLRLSYGNSIRDALLDLGKSEQIGVTFESFQKYLYQPHRLRGR